MSNLKLVLEQKLKIKRLEQERESMVRGFREILKESVWARDTIRSKLNFGLDEVDAIKSRESRSKGVFLTTISICITQLGG